jgi:predicted nucleic acid-binding protein
LPELAVDNAVWSTAFDLARRARTAGISVPATDILIAACARHHEVELERADSDFSHLARLEA